MALEALFQDRSVRHSLRTQIREAKEIGFGECDSCGRNQSLISVFNHNICEDCCNKILNESYNFDRVFESALEQDDIDKMLSESYVIPDLKKLEADAQAKFNGSIPNLMRSYGLNPHKDWDDRYSKGMVFIRDNEISGGRTRVNQFIIDYDCSFTVASAAQKLVPDGKTGVSAPLKVKGKPISTAQVPSNGSQPASTNNIATQSSSHLVQKNIQAGPGIKADGDNQFFKVKLTPGLTLECQRTATGTGNMQGAEVKIDKYPNWKMTYYVDKGSKNVLDNDSLAKGIIENIKKAPESIFQAFTEDDMKDGYVINKYPAYSFKFDEKSFDGRNISLILTLNGKAFEKSRVYLSDKALFKRVNLDAELRDFMDDRLKRTYPMLFNGTADVKTSIGKASTDFISVEASDKYKLGEISLRTEIGNVSIPWKCGGERFTEKDLTHNTVCDIIYSAFSKLIPGYGDPALKTGAFAGSATDSFSLENLDDNGMKYSMVATFDLNDLYDKGDIVFKMSVLDDHTGEEQPKNLQPIVYRQAGVSLKEFLEKESKKIHAHYFKKSDMQETLTQSAREKMGNASKREALFSKICDTIMDKLRFADRTKWGDISINLDSFEVNKDGKVTNAVIRFFDEDQMCADTSVDLAKFMNAEQSLSFLKFKKADDSPRGMSEFGPSVVYDVKDIKKFSEFANLAILEELIFEAFGLTHVNESGRKQIYV